MNVLWSTTALLLVQAAHSTILLTGHVTDVPKMAKQLMDSPIGGQLANIVQRAYDEFNNQHTTATRRADDGEDLTEKALNKSINTDASCGLLYELTAKTLDEFEDDVNKMEILVRELSYKSSKENISDSTLTATLEIPKFYCKNITLAKKSSGTPYLMQENTLNSSNAYCDPCLHHVKASRNFEGLLTFFKINIAVKGGSQAGLYYWDDANELTYFEIVIGDLKNQRTVLKQKKDKKLHNIIEKNTPNILSKNEFRTYSITIDNGKLEIRAEGDESPILTHSDTRLKLLNYFNFKSHDDVLEIQFDCPSSSAMHGAQDAWIGRNLKKPWRRTARAS